MNGTTPLARKFHSLTGRITVDLMHSAFLNVRKNRGAAGIDRQSIAMFQRHLDQNLMSLMRDLKKGLFQPLPSRRTYVDKAPGKKRPLGIPCVRDRVAQEVLRQLLNPLMEALFHDQSYGFRPGRSCHIALNFLDWQLEEAGFRFVRYADDFVVLCKSRERAEEARAFVEQRISELGLQLSPEKTKVTRFMDGFAFLGFEITHRSRRMRQKSVEKFKDRMRELTTRSHNLDAETVTTITSVIRGVAHYFAPPFATVTKQFEKLDHWLRSRLRSMKYKRKSKNDNFRLLNKHLQRLGMIWLSDFVPDT